MTSFSILKDTCKNMEVYYFSDNSAISKKLIKKLKVDFTNLSIFKVENILKIDKLNCSLLIFDMNGNNDNEETRKKLVEFSKQFVILLGLSPNSDLSLYDKLKSDYEINSFDKSNINAVMNVLTNSIKYIKKQSVITSLESKVSEFKKILEIYDEHIIASIADKKGVIKYATKAFSLISGYSNKELLGQKHSIVRHQDQNKSTFIELWKTLLEGKTWKGEIKNKKKNGDAYWVYATISPEFDQFDNIVGYSAIRQDITEKKHIEYLAITDSLTKLYNRRYFDTMLERELKNSHRHHYNLSLILLDIDYFKQYNDTYGHPEGDNALVKVAACIKNTFKRPDDYVFRVGGEEFAILFNVEEKIDSLLLAESLLINLKKENIKHKNSKVSDLLTVSIGLSYIENGTDTNTKALYKITDNILYQAKRSGRNQIKSISL